MKRNKLNLAILAALTASATPDAIAQLEEVVVTATRREESAQDIPISVHVLTQESLRQTGVAKFGDYLLQLPSMTSGGVAGPGRSTVYIRGLGYTAPNAYIANRFGLVPNVAFYLDEQPLVQPGRNLDVYPADLERIEVISGPQGTLFGASAQAGAVRMITNKPDPAEPYGRVQVGAAAIKDGGVSNHVEAMLNLPATDNLTLRSVAFRDRQGGWVDNVPDTRDIRSSRRFRPAGLLRPNGTVITGTRVGFLQSRHYIPVRGEVLPATLSPAALERIDALRLSDPTAYAAACMATPAACRSLAYVGGGTVDNRAHVADDINQVTYSGGRLMALYEFGADWRVLASHMQQTTDSDGVFSSDPTLGEHQTARFTDEETHSDSFDNTQLTIEGRLGPLEMVYSGAFNDRDTEQLSDYTDYLYNSPDLPFYVCESGVHTNPDPVGNPTWQPTGMCHDPSTFLDAASVTETQTHELRFSSDPAAGFRATFGGFFSDTEIKDLMDLRVPASVEVYAPGTNPSHLDGLPGVVRRYDITRTQQQLGAFGEVEWDFVADFTVTAGARFYDIEYDLLGSRRTARADIYPTSNFTEYFDGTGGVPDKGEEDGVVGKLALSWQPNDGALFYGSWAQGFRPGVFNEISGFGIFDTNVGDQPAIIGKGYSSATEVCNQFWASAGPAAGIPVTVTCNRLLYLSPDLVETDEVETYELGWKADLLGNTLRLNGAFYRTDIANLQSSVGLFSGNAVHAEISGFKTDVLWRPGAVPGLSLSGSVNFLDSEITGEAFNDIYNEIEVGTPLSHAPEHQGNLQARYEWRTGDVAAFVMPQLIWSDALYSDLLAASRYELEAWQIVNLSSGIAADEWSMELYINNIADEAAQVSGDAIYEVLRIAYAQPRTIGFRFAYDF